MFDNSEWLCPLKHRGNLSPSLTLDYLYTLFPKIYTYLFLSLKKVVLINFADPLTPTSVLLLIISQWYMWFNVTEICSRYFVQCSVSKSGMSLQKKPSTILSCHEDRESQSLDEPISVHWSFSVFDSKFILRPQLGCLTCCLHD